MRKELADKYYASEEYRKRLEGKLRLLHSMNDPSSLAVLKRKFADDPVLFIETCLMVKIPELGSAIKPFFLFPYQSRVILKLKEMEESGEDVELLIDKLRAMGLTWLVSAFMTWRFMTKPYWSGFVLSRTETEVDDGTDSPDTSIFGKIRFFLAFMPASLVPPELLSSLTQKKGTNFNKRLHLLNPETHATINGSSTNSGAGRSKRFNFVFIDEAFFIDRFMEIRRSLESVARVRVYVSSVKAGMTQENFKKMCAAKGRYITLSWHDHPWKDQIWYDEKMANIKFDPEIAKEIEVDYSISSVDQYYPEIKSAKICPVQYDPDKPLYVGLDFGKQDLTVMVFAQLNGPYLDIIECYANKEKKAEWYLPFLNPEYVIGDESQYDERHYDTLNRVRSWRRPQYWFGESAHFTKVMPYNMSIADVLRKGGVTLRCNRNAIKYEPRRMATSSLLPKMRFNEESEQVMELKDAVARTRYSKLITGSEGKPMHDGETGDYRSALENLCVNVPLIMRNQREALADEWKGNFYSGLIRYLKI